MSCGRCGVDEMSEALLAKDRRRAGDAVENTFDVDVDHVLPILDALDFGVRFCLDRSVPVDDEEATERNRLEHTKRDGARL
jgi:hypothetical protein